MIDGTAIIITIEFLATIVILAGLIFWLDRKQTERLDRFQDDMRQMQQDTRQMQRDTQVLSSKVDRMQGTLDVLVFGERGVPPPVARERAEAEGRVEETVGD